MTIRPIIKAPDPRLKVISKPIVVVDDGVRELMDDMLDSMYAANGIGLAAPQIGDPRRVIVLDISRDGEKRIKHQLANPEIIWKSDEQYADVSRPARVRISFLDYNNEFREIQAEGMLAVCIQHEVDHLDGVLFVDHISALKRNIILRRLIKAKRLEEAGVA
jgi:peptide deformylase